MNDSQELIYDVGLFDGEDTAYYLHRGYRVVAIDANPGLIERARSRFDRDIAKGRLTLLNIGISETVGTSTFWISDQPEWSSFDRSIASRDNTPHRPVSVSSVPFSQILSEYGVPHYLKVDIEGKDALCVTALRGTTLPQYISVETECIGDSVVLSEKESTAMLDLLREIGYSRFKLVKQQGWIPARPPGIKRFCQRLTNSAARGRLRVSGFAAIAERFTDSGRLAALGFPFAPGASGPWGEDIPGGWMTFTEARATYLLERQTHFSTGRPPLYSFWYDWHATF